MTINYWLLGIIGVLIIVIIILFKEYFQKKGECLVAQEEICRVKKKAETEIEEQIERIKKEHQLDIEKRKHQYATKHAEFKKFFSLLDEFKRSSHKTMWEEINPIIVKINEEYLNSEQNSDSGTSAKAITEFSNSLLILTKKMNDECTGIRNEINSIKLISPPDVIELLEEFDKLLETSINAAMSVVRGMATPEFIANQKVIDPLKVKAEDIGKLVKNKHVELVEAMRNHLDVI